MKVLCANEVPWFVHEVKKAFALLFGFAGTLTADYTAARYCTRTHSDSSLNSLGLAIMRIVSRLGIYL